ncbi:hypothetical protein G6M70_11290 [Agrobacterium tumefaciens]|uniref:hypothetical protein n=1 Tax=Agrobacterium tumefaciens TaxID=358 RepID=UPI0015749FA9|nr:hypothetical protein [Agrobacterium tumefaciens]NSZ03170.1 hypothetical protein [Agrobacterium tumefaciens]NSZ39785.1 hypothetical protein [Agrobacterium tumefaciens]NTB26743.1 hypothetical protein [Agrobacterium tumefaciens]NTB31863.1 hypothetical protein [Agrobacterium tumefaciens]NTB34308.1 hypothetical protein [Agrobacterium tumefaciens]
MLSVGIKIALGLCALVVAVIAALEWPLSSKLPEDTKKTLWKRLTKAGRVNLVCAAAAFLLVGVSEVMDYFDSKESVAAAKAQDDLVNEHLSTAQANLEAAKMAVGQSLLDMAALKRENEYWVRTLDKSVVRAGVARLRIEDSSGAGDPLRFTGGVEVSPNNGDQVEWKFVCNGGPPPINQISDTTCKGIGYGRLMANGFPIVLNEASGRGVFFGTRSTGETLEYRNPSEDYICNDLTVKMEAAQCELQLSVWTEARWEFSELKKNDPRDTVALETQDACRRYTALYGETCEAAVERLRKK